jgi:3-methyladenine DNA glycosylase AlkD
MHALVKEVRTVLRENADPERAAKMQAYMKSAMPYRGVTSPVQRGLFKEIFARHAALSCEDTRAIAGELFGDAKFREERYAAIALVDPKRRAMRGCQTMEALPLYEEMIVTGAWWDFVDWIASHHLGAILASERKPMTARMSRWATDGHLWKRRAAILCQLKMKKETDLDLLYEAIDPNVGDKDFFMRKAIGWALREYAKTDAREVVRFVEANRTRLSGLSVREALKNL